MIPSIIRRLKLSYILYNLFHPSALKHNVPLYRKLGLRKSYFSPVSSRDFAALPDTNELTSEGRMSQSFTETALYTSLDAESRGSLDAFEQNGYCVIRGYLPSETADQINDEVGMLLREKKAKLVQGRKIMFAFHQSPLMSAIGKNPVLLELLSALLYGKAMLFQSMNFLKGSELATHSDSIHMTTYPLGGLLGVWIALEDSYEANGPLHYYPGSHKLPYYLNAEYGNEGNWLFNGPKDYRAYEKMIEGKIKEMGLRKETWHAKKGDLMIWHANLFHGGEPVRDHSLTRKSLVLHYFREEAVCYHEITQRPALIQIL